MHASQGHATALRHDGRPRSQRRHGRLDDHPGAGRAPVSSSGKKGSCCLARAMYARSTSAPSGSGPPSWRGATPSRCTAITCADSRRSCARRMRSTLGFSQAPALLGHASLMAWCLAALGRPCSPLCLACARPPCAPQPHAPVPVASPAAAKGLEPRSASRLAVRHADEDRLAGASGHVCGHQRRAVLAPQCIPAEAALLEAALPYPPAFPHQSTGEAALPQPPAFSHQIHR